MSEYVFYMSKYVLSLESEVILEVKIYGFFIILDGWSNDRYEGGLKILRANHRFWSQIDPGPRETPISGIF